MFLRRIVLAVAIFASISANDVFADVVYGRPEGSMQLGGRVDLNSDLIFDFNFSSGTVCTDSIPGSCSSWYSIQGYENPYDWNQGVNNNGVLTLNSRAASLELGVLIAQSTPGVEWLNGFRDTPIEGIDFAFDPARLKPRIGYLGVQFDAADGSHFGWIQLRLNTIGSTLDNRIYFLEPPSVLDWAYESTPNTPIVAGAVPEPRTWILALLFAVLVAAWKFRKGVLPFLMCMFVPVAAHGEIIYGQAARPGSHGLFDLNIDGRDDFKFANWSVGNPFDILHVFYSIQRANELNGFGVLTNGEFVPPLLAGTSIGPNASSYLWSDDFDAERIPGVSPVGMLSFNPPLPNTHFIGVRFTANDGLHYGWIRLAKSSWAPFDTNHPDYEPPTGPPGAFPIPDIPRIDTFGPGVIDWAYETTPNTPVVVGAVPEPGTCILALIFAALVAAWKLHGRVLPFLLCILIPAAANGEIIHRTAARPGSWEPFDLDANGQLDYLFGVKAVATDPDHLSIYFAIEQAGGAGNSVLTGGDEVPALPLGFVIGPDAQALTWDDGFVDREIPDVAWADGLLGFPPLPPTQFVGIRLQGDDGWHYGWVRLAQTYWAPFDMNHPNWPDDPGSVPLFALPRTDSFNPGVIDWAYESTPDTPIVAGAVPEPGSVSLVVVGMLAVALWWWRKGRRSAN